MKETLSLFFLFCLFMSATPVGAQSLEELQQIGIPLLQIETAGQVEPTCDYVHSPDGYLGNAIANPTKVPGRMKIYKGKDVLYDSGEYVDDESGMKIRIRGNTSAYHRKKPYKINLEVKADLLFRGNDEVFADKEWVLLRTGTDLHTQMGSAVSHLVGMQWTPAWQYVNVVMNGEYRGLYILIESVKRNPLCRLNVDAAQGCIIEYDAYIWNEEFYIPSAFTNVLGWTFKYPKADGLPKWKRQYIESLINAYEEGLMNYSYESVIDMQSFARWILGHDILGTSDQGGTNEYFIVVDYTAAARKLVMPMMWDFDTVFETPGEWSRCHDRQFFFVHLFNSKNLAFTKAYVKEWRAFESSGKMEVLKQSLVDYAAGLEAQSLNESRILDAKHYGTNYTTVQHDVQEVLAWLESREAWMQERIFEMELSFNPDVALGVDSIIKMPKMPIAKKIIRDGRIFILDGENSYGVDGLRKR